MDYDQLFKACNDASTGSLSTSYMVNDVTTKDIARIEHYEHTKNFYKPFSSKMFTYASDYAKSNGATSSIMERGYKKRQTSCMATAASYKRGEILATKLNGDMCDYVSTTDTFLTIAPTIYLDADALSYQMLNDRDSFKIDEVYAGNKQIYHTLELGEYPQDRAQNSTALETAFQNNDPALVKTGKTYVGGMNIDGTFARNEEFSFNGEKYVRVISNRYEKCPQQAKYKDGSHIAQKGSAVWHKVQPIKWIIKNWFNLPMAINPTGHGRTNTVVLTAEEGLMGGIPMYTSADNNLWQNCIWRAVLNGYNLHDEIARGNGNPIYQMPENFDYTDEGFLKEAFDYTRVITKEVEEPVEEIVVEPEPPVTKRKSRLERLNPDTTPQYERRKMSDTELIKNWVDAGQSVLLTGPSGIGKTQRIKELYPDLIYIKLTNNMFPEKVVGSMNLQTGQSIPPDFAKEAILSCATDAERKMVEENVQNLFSIADDIYARTKNSDKKVVILLDELLNVKPAVQSLVYTLVLNRIVETGKGLKLPANTVVVATGNQKKYSSVAQDLAEPLEKRFDHILDMEPKVGEWLYEFAIPKKLHPSVIGYIFSKYIEKNKSEKIEDIGYFYEEPEVGEKNLDKNGCKGRTNDPRGWESISNMLYAFEEDLQKGKLVGKNVEKLLETSLKSKLREEWAGEFYDYYNHPTLSIEEVVNKNYSKEDLPANINEKFATMAGLLGASESEVEKCREFIHENCNPEYLSVYDIYWAGNDPNRIEKIAKLKELEVSKESEIKEM